VETIIPFDITIPDLQAFSFVGLPAGGIMDSRQPGNDYVEKQISFLRMFSGCCKIEQYTLLFVVLEEFEVNYDFLDGLNL